MTNVPLVQNFSLPGEICRKFALDWSADNKISICTSKAIYILTSYCSPVETGFPSPLHKQVIKAPDKPMQLSNFKPPQNPYKHIRSDQDRQFLYNVLLDHTLNPTPPERAEAFRSFRCCKWSPKGAANANRCLLATLTMDHRLCLHEESEKEWRLLCDLTQLTKEQLQAEQEAPKKKLKKATPSKFRTRSKRTEEVEEEKTEEKKDGMFNIQRECNYEKLMEETYRFAPMEITWTGMFGSAPTNSNDKSYEFCFLIVAMKSGHVQFWKVSPSDGKIVSLAHEWDTGLGLLTNISWQQTSSVAGFLMCGSYKGILAFLPIGINLSTEQEPRVVVKNMCKVWDEEDRVAVDHIAILKIALRKYVVIAAKLHALVGCEIILTEDSIIIRNVGHSFGLHTLPITGMAVLDTRSMPQYKVLVSTMEGDVIEIKVSLGNDDIKFQHEKVHVDLDLKNNMIQGLALSSNGLLCGLILNTSVYFDHLEKKEPLQFAMFVTKPFEDIYTRLKSVLKPQFSFLSSSSGATIGHHTDYLECVRVNLACGAPSLPDWVTQMVDSDPQTYENCSPMELYFIRFLIHAYVSGLAISAPKVRGAFEVKLYAAEALIMRNYISRVFSGCQDSLDLLSPGQAQSLLLMADWLLKEFQMPVEGLYSALGCDTPTDPDTLPARETCDICKGEVPLDNIKVGQCSKNHQFARCCQSLLLCDVVPYRQCPSCKSVALKDLWNNDLACTYCGMAMV
ncbi:hypothetical protein JTE90_016354 [Oedothorax gibbosus]|uniref:Transcription factor IIIC 90kDa subunit N-terminal domain-containing protein n=1 Tax=Oedothorax gibbosus TaxID=931172 RepID=A0AAV6U8L7_9ARAC|nr:hypothetical protein JTE90_016354 [Oedothorax gibbosus]